MMNRFLLNSPFRSAAISASIAGVLTLVMPHAAHASLASQDTRGIPVHYVRLTGYGGDNDVNRNNLIVAHQACVRTQTAFGKPAKTLAPGEIPAVISTQEVEIYYAANRTLTVKQGILHDIDRDTCALVAIPHRTAELQSSAGRCDIDLIKKTARGQCDASLHERAAVHPAGIRPPKVDLEKVPLSMRAQVQAQVERLEQLGRAKPDTSGPAQSDAQRKTVAGLPCEVYRNEAMHAIWCIARPAASPARPLVPYPIPAAPLNSGISGVLLEARSPALTLQAQQIRLNTSVSVDLFAIPPDVRVNTVSGGRR